MKKRVRFSCPEHELQHIPPIYEMLSFCIFFIGIYLILLYL